MGSEIIRRRDTGTALIRKSDARSTMDAALARMRGSHAMPLQRPTPGELSSYRSVAQDVVDIPRICAVHGAPYVARYVWSENRYRYAQSIRFRTALSDQYVSRPEFEAVVPAKDIGEETCAWCGASGDGAVRCGTCKRLMCLGKTVGNYFRCHDGCPGKGVITPTTDPLGKGLNPSHIARAGGYGA